jgi:predicted amidohydrolase YtcJ
MKVGFHIKAIKQGQPATFLRITLPSFLLLSLLFLAACQPKPVDMVFYNGRILTMDEHNTEASAVAVQDGRILAVGNFCDVWPYFFSPRVRRVNLHGKTMVPGFVDAHSHFPGGSVYEFMADLNSPPVGTVSTIAHIQDALRPQVGAPALGDWIVGFSYDDLRLEERRHPTRNDLDAVSQDNPVWIFHISGHVGVANSRALSLAGIDENTPDPEGGVIRRIPGTNVPNGILEESAMDIIILDLLPDPSISQILTMLADGGEKYAAKGVTTAQNGAALPLYVSALWMASQLDILPVRVVVWPYGEAADGIVEGTFDISQMKSNRFTVGAMKLIADGSIQAYSGFLGESYFLVPPDKPENYRGYPRMTQEALNEQVLRFHQSGHQVAVHGNGDGIIDFIINAFDEAQAVYPREDTRPIVVHAQMTRDDQLDRMQALEMVPSFFPLHTWYYGDAHMEIFMGPDRARRMSPARSALRRGMRFTLHADTPVFPMDPMRIMWSAVNRVSDRGTPIYFEDEARDQRISPLEALRAVTIDTAWQLHLEDSRGSIEAGKFADLVILSENPLDIPAGLHNVEVLETIMGGRTVYCASTR